jgi:mRNA interferase RelE/StbE
VYEVQLERAAERNLRRRSSENFTRMIAYMKTLGENPRPPGCRKITGSRNDWRIRVGDYRIIYEIDDNAMVIRVLRIRHRRDAYR